MFVEERIYTVQPGKAPDFLKLYEEEGMAIQARHLPYMVGYYTSEIGTLNLIVHLWAFDDINQRVRLREQMVADPDWQNYLKKLMPLIVDQQSRILRPASFFEPRLRVLVDAAKAARAQPA
ncbi:NIPSNAP protein [Paraburkholderia caballeronis]|uniref:NIPSNAP family protein n=1 Tax=Paraburkholderia caballeronis TaxID=416943 RepID=UPI001064D563|nr:NIPSNAP family protein [Paraburkholderia caballeronis]TDV35614.1 NIPSNAP protein [Paraburkholderia caballeronis]